MFNAKWGKLTFVCKQNVSFEAKRDLNSEEYVHQPKWFYQVRC